MITPFVIIQTTLFKNAFVNRSLFQYFIDCSFIIIIIIIIIEGIIIT